MQRIHHLLKVSLASALLLAVPAPSLAGVFVGASVGVGVGFGVGVSVNIAPPAIPVYVQPPCPVEGYLWTPGYWGWGPAGYFWVPGTWVEPPAVGVLWTPGYWGWSGGLYAWHPGFWGPHIGFYGGVNYGFGYFGVGYVGGAWVGNAFRYNTAVTNVNVTVVHDVYVNRTVIEHDNGTVSRVSYNGGTGGTTAAPTDEERAAEQERQSGLSRAQRQHINVAAHDRNLLSSVNDGHPAQLAVDRPFNPENRPADSAPIQAQDRESASGAVVHNPAGANASAANTGSDRSDAWNRFGAGRQTDATTSSAGRPSTDHDAAPSDARPENSTRQTDTDDRPSYAQPRAQDEAAPGRSATENRPEAGETAARPSYAQPSTGPHPAVNTRQAHGKKAAAGSNKGSSHSPSQERG